MYSSIIFLLFMSFLLLYNLSKKTNWEDKPRWAIILESRPALSWGISLSLMLLGSFMLILFNGIGSGLFGFVVILMCMASLTVLLFPFRYLSALHILLIYALFLGLENLFYYAG